MAACMELTLSPLEKLPRHVSEIVFDHLSHVDLLNVRTTSKRMMCNVKEYTTRLQQRLESENVQFETEVQFAKFVECVKFSPFSNFLFSFNPWESSSKSLLKDFLLMHGKRVKRLEFPDIHLFMEDFEFELFEKVPNLQEIVVDNVKLWGFGSKLILPNLIAYCNSTSGRAVMSAPTYPPCFSSIKSFEFFFACDSSVLEMFLKSLPNLRKLQMGSVDIGPNTFTSSEDYSVIKLITRYLNFKNEGSNSNSLDLLSPGLDIQDEDYPEIILQTFVKEILRNETSLNEIKDVFVCNILDCSILSESEKQAFCDRVVHLVDFCPNLSYFSFSKLQSLCCVVSDYDYAPGFYLEDYGNPLRVNWKSLECIFVKLEFDNEVFDTHKLKIQGFWNFLFGIARNSVTSIRLETTVNHPDAKLVINPTIVAYNFFNLQSLVLDLPFYNQEDYIGFFEKLSENAEKLKYLDITIWCTATSRMFYGPDYTKSSFLEMKELKHLRIREEGTPSSEQWVVSRKFDFVRDVIPNLSLSCLLLSTLNPYSVFRKTPERVEAVNEGKVSSSLRALFWTEMGNDKHSRANCELDKKVKENKEKIVYFPSLGQRCRYCENTINEKETHYYGSIKKH